MQSVAETKPMEEPPHTHFGFRVFATNRTHVSRPLLSSQYVRHAYILDSEFGLISISPWSAGSCT
jgi:hypothetical protein